MRLALLSRRDANGDLVDHPAGIGALEDERQLHGLRAGGKDADKLQAAGSDFARRLGELQVDDQGRAQVEFLLAVVGEGGGPIGSGISLAEAFEARSRRTAFLSARDRAPLGSVFKPT